MEKIENHVLLDLSFTKKKNRNYILGKIISFQYILFSKKNRFGMLFVNLSLKNTNKFIFYNDINPLTLYDEESKASNYMLSIIYKYMPPKKKMKQKQKQKQSPNVRQTVTWLAWTN